jgi:hypothetical protein
VVDYLITWSFAMVDYLNTLSFASFFYCLFLSYYHKFLGMLTLFSSGLFY